MRAIHWSVPLCLMLVLAACGSDEPAATPTAGTGEASDARGDDDARKPPALAKGLRSPEAQAVDALIHASQVRVLRLEPGTAGARPDCRTGRCIEGNLIESGLLLRDPDAAGNAASVVRAWLLESATATDVDCDPAYHQAVVFNGSGHEFALLMDRDCGAYQLLVDQSIAASGFVEVPDEDPVAQALLGGDIRADSFGDDPATDEEGEAGEPAAPVEGEGEAAPDPEEEGGEAETDPDATITT